MEFCGGEASELTIAGEMPEWRREISLRPDRLRTFGGVDVSAKRATQILNDLGFEAKSSDGVITAVAPSWRADVEGEHCLVEEVLRVHGFDRIPVVAMARETALPEPAINAAQRRVAFAKRTLAVRGMMEAVTWSFTGAREAGLFGGGHASLALANPISADLDVMRPSILPNLLAAAGRNADRGNGDVALFEVGPTYRDDTAGGQDTVAAGLRHGHTGPRHWRAEAREVVPQRQHRHSDQDVHGQVRIDGEQPRDACRVLSVHRWHPHVERHHGQLHHQADHEKDDGAGDERRARHFVQVRDLETADLAVDDE